eukprot:TRINITY_DN36234_c0_g1_i1.p1 TRINITY_DN36234_c0_g1~~TRINITY_DN36234_c0_g1_i1.p1  ORF type:complete len:1600 (-),score=242.97 TRINITY_DN36234_c0_g1_i1:250-4581(-)
MQPVVIDDPSTSQPDDHWLHPCDCIPEAWADGPINPESRNSIPSGSHNEFLPSSIELVRGNMICEKDFVQSVIYQQGSADAQSCQTSCSVKSGCNYYWEGEVDGVQACFLFSKCTTLISQQGIEGTLFALPSGNKMCKVADAEACWKVTRRRETLGAGEAFQSECAYEHLIRQCDLQLLSGSTHVQHCARCEYTFVTSAYMWKQKTPLPPSFEHGKQLTAACWAERLAGVAKSSGEVSKETLSCVGGEWIPHSSPRDRTKIYYYSDSTFWGLSAADIGSGLYEARFNKDVDSTGLVLEGSSLIYEGPSGSESCHMYLHEENLRWDCNQPGTAAEQVVVKRLGVHLLAKPWCVLKPTSRSAATKRATFDCTGSTETLKVIRWPVHSVSPGLSNFECGDCLQVVSAPYGDYDVKNRQESYFAALQEVQVVVDGNEKLLFTSSGLMSSLRNAVGFDGLTGKELAIWGMEWTASDRYPPAISSSLLQSNMSESWTLGSDAKTTLNALRHATELPPSYRKDWCGLQVDRESQQIQPGVYNALFSCSEHAETLQLKGSWSEPEIAANIDGEECKLAAADYVPSVPGPCRDVTIGLKGVVGFCFIETGDWPTCLDLGGKANVCEIQANTGGGHCSDFCSDLGMTCAYAADSLGTCQADKENCVSANNGCNVERGDQICGCTKTAKVAPPASDSIKQAVFLCPSASLLETKTKLENQDLPLQFISPSKQLAGSYNKEPTCYLRGGFAFIQAEVNSGIENQRTIATLPPQCRPAKTLSFLAGSMSESYNRVEAYSDGRLRFMAGKKTNSWVSLNSVVFATSAVSLTSMESYYKYGASSAYSRTHQQGEASFAVSGGICLLQGKINRGTSNLMMTLPSQCRPSATRIFMVLVGDGDKWQDDDGIGTARINIKSNGNVEWGGSKNFNPWMNRYYINLNGIAFAVTSDGESPISFGTGWSNYGAGYKEPSYSLLPDVGICMVQGTAKRSSSTYDFTTVATLPPQCRPQARTIFNLGSHTNYMRADVFPTGEIQVISGTIFSVYFDLTFFVLQPLTKLHEISIVPAYGYMNLRTTIPGSQDLCHLSPGEASSGPRASRTALWDCVNRRRRASLTKIGTTGFVVKEVESADPSQRLLQTTHVGPDPLCMVAKRIDSYQIMQEEACKADASKQAIKVDDLQMFIFNSMQQQGQIPPPLSAPSVDRRRRGNPFADPALTQDCGQHALEAFGLMASCDDCEKPAPLMYMICGNAVSFGSPSKVQSNVFMPSTYDYWMEAFAIKCPAGSAISFLSKDSTSVSWKCSSIAGLSTCSPSESFAISIKQKTHAEMIGLEASCGAGYILQSLEPALQNSGKSFRIRYTCCRVAGLPAMLRPTGEALRSQLHDGEGLYCPMGRDLTGRLNFKQQVSFNGIDLTEHSVLKFDEHKGQWCVGDNCQSSGAAHPLDAFLVPLSVGPFQT